MIALFVVVDDMMTMNIMRMEEGADVDFDDDDCKMVNAKQVVDICIHGDYFRSCVISVEIAIVPRHARNAYVRATLLLCVSCVAWWPVGDMDRVCIGFVTG